MQQEGKISVTAEDMLPIIKKWLYSEHDIFLRELVSNAVDAITKHKHLSMIGEVLQKDVAYRIEIAVNEQNKTLHIKDNGIGMDGEEVKKYIAQLAFSGAKDFFDKYQGASQPSDQMIGHFGLGFYSSFMVADKVEIYSQSARENTKPVHWVCEGSTNYTLTELEENRTHGTEIILHINEESLDFLKEYELKNTFKRHSGFVPVPVFINGEEQNTKKAIWNEQSSSLGEKDYEELYDHLFPFQEKALFHVHINIDTPFQVRGILWFQKFKAGFESFKGRIKLFCNRVFVSDSIEDLFPSYLFMLQGVIDCPDIPLNVSRSALQGDPRIKKIGQHLVKKVADRLSELFKKEREQYEKFWEDISPFVKFGIMQDEKFHEKVHDLVLYKTTQKEGYTTLSDYLERNKDKHANRVYYASGEKSQGAFLDLFKAQGLEALILDDTIDSHFIQHMEIKNQDLKFSRVDSELEDSLLDKTKNSTIVDQDNKTKEDKIRETFIQALGNEKLTVRVEHIRSENVSGMILLSEHMRRFQEISALSMQKSPEFPLEHTLVINAQSPVVTKILDLKEKMRSEDARMVCEHVYDLALMTHQNLGPDKMKNFVERSNKILTLLS